MQSEHAKRFPSAYRSWTRALLTVVFFLPVCMTSACGLVNESRDTSPAIQHAVALKPAAAPKKHINEAKVLQGDISKMAARLFRHLQEPDPENGVLADGVIVCTFVDLSKLSRTSSFGRYLAEQLMNELQQRNYKVVELRKGEDVRIQEKRGEYGLSRDPERVNSSVAAGAMLTGTYMAARDSIVVSARIIDNRTAALLSSASFIFPRNALSALLLSDSASASTGNKEPVYMKRLQL